VRGLQTTHGPQLRESALRCGQKLGHGVKPYSGPDASAREVWLTSIEVRRIKPVWHAKIHRAEPGSLTESRFSKSASMSNSARRNCVSYEPCVIKTAMHDEGRLLIPGLVKKFGTLE
jgi:hypothetical protein